MANVVDFKFTGDTTDVKKSFGQLDQMFGKLSGALGALGLAFGAVELIKFAGQQLEVADQFGKMALKAGVATDQFSRLSYAFELSDVSAESLSTGFKFLNKNIAEATHGGSSAQKSFASIGISMADLKTKSPDQIMLKVAESMAGVSDASAKSAMMMQLFGRSGTDLIPAMDGGRDAVEKLMAEADQLGYTVDDAFAKAADQFGDSMQKISMASAGFTRQLLSKALPILQTTIDTIFDFGATGEDSVLPWSDIFKKAVGVVALAMLALSTTVKTSAIVITSDLKIVGGAMGAIAAALVTAATGDMKGAWAILQEGWSDARATTASATAAIVAENKKYLESSQKIVAQMGDVAGSVEKTGKVLDAEKSKPKYDPLSTEAAGRIESLHQKYLKFISDLTLSEASASGRRLDLIQIEYDAQIATLNQLGASKAEQAAALKLIDRSYVAARIQLQDEMLARLGIGDEQYRERKKVLAMIEADQMAANGLSQVQSDKFLKNELISQEIEYLSAKRAAIGDAYLSFDQIVIASAEAEKLRLDQSLAQDLISREEHAQAVREMEINKNAELGEFLAIESQRRIEYSRMSTEQQIDHVKNTMGDLSLFMASKNKEMFAIGKAFAIANAIMATYQSATAAYLSAAAIVPFGHLLAPAAAAAAVVAGLSNVARIRASQPQAHAGLTEVKSEGTFLLSKGERVLQPEQNKDLTRFLTGQEKANRESNRLPGGVFGGVQVEQINISISVDDGAALKDMSSRDWEEILSRNLIPAFDVLDSKGLRPKFALGGR